ncbi:MAG: DUF1572 family protein [Bacillota bacterium]|nr:DUF1572 family protein [Bacillota bacterium]
MSSRDEQLVALFRGKLQELHSRTVAALQQLGDEDVNWRPNEESNSIVNLAVHLAGNLQQRMEAGIAGGADRRDRDAEFNERKWHARDEVLAILDGSLAMTDRVLQELGPGGLDAVQRIRNRETTVLEVLLTVTHHVAEHIGQMLYIAKLRLGPAYRVVSIPHRKV